MKGLSLLVAFLLTSGIFAQQAYLINSELSTMTLSGETNWSTWEEQVTEFKGSLRANTDVDQTNLVAIELQIPVDAIEAPRKGMINDTFEALKKKEYPEITFASSSITLTQNQATITGKLTIAGVTKPATIISAVQFLDEKIILRGQHTLYMKDFEVIPPKAMMGTLQVEQEVVITFNLAFVLSK